MVILWSTPVWLAWPRQDVPNITSIKVELSRLFLFGILPHTHQSAGFLDINTQGTRGRKGDVGRLAAVSIHCFLLRVHFSEYFPARSVSAVYSCERVKTLFFGMLFLRVFFGRWSACRRVFEARNDGLSESAPLFRGGCVSRAENGMGTNG